MDVLKPSELRRYLADVRSRLLLEVEMLPDLEKAKSNEAAAEKVGSVTKHMEHILDVLALFPDQNQKFVKDLTK